MIAALVVAVLVFLIRAPESTWPDSGPGGWLKGSDAEKIDRIAEHLGGYGITMWEVGYRYRELAWAGQVEDWDYARHQIHEIEEALLLGIERRPAYKEGTMEFIRTGLKPLENALHDEPDADRFITAFQLFTASCIQCHNRENAPLMDIKRWARADPRLTLLDRD